MKREGVEAVVEGGGGRRPPRIWWARPGRLCVLERPGGGGRSHRPDRREAEIAYLRAQGVRLVVSTMATRHNLAAYEAAGLRAVHLPGEGPEALEAVLALLRGELRGPGAVAVHGNRRTDFVAAVAAAHLHEAEGVAPEEGLRAAEAAGLAVTREGAALLGVERREPGG